MDNKYKASEKNIEIIYKKKDYVVQGGPLLQELFSNIIENSVEHSDCDKIMISCKEVDDVLMIVFEDDGKGISKDDKKKIFERGFKKGESAGSGLGMYLVKQIAENYGGKVEVKDSRMGGARFDVHLKRMN
ncbi:MAG: sensor histidine kinase [Thermoplasmatota archaeon]